MKSCFLHIFFSNGVGHQHTAFMCPRSSPSVNFLEPIASHDSKSLLPPVESAGRGCRSGLCCCSEKGAKAEVCCKPPKWKWPVCHAASILSSLNLKSHQGKGHPCVSVCCVLNSHLYYTNSSTKQVWQPPVFTEMVTISEFKTCSLDFAPVLKDVCTSERAQPVLHAKSCCKILTHELDHLFFSRFKTDWWIKPRFMIWMTVAKCSQMSQHLRIEFMACALCDGPWADVLLLATFKIWSFKNCFMK